jgi:hypothetical protein
MSAELRRESKMCARLLATRDVPIIPRHGLGGNTPSRYSLLPPLATFGVLAVVGMQTRREPFGVCGDRADAGIAGRLQSQ